LQIDSNFWSTLAQTVIGCAGLYTIIIPLLRKADINPRNELVFHGTLIFSLATAVLGVIIYHFQTRTSLILNFLSSVAQLVATLQLVDDAGTQITAQKEEIVYNLAKIDHQNSEIDDLEREVYALQAVLQRNPEPQIE
jgi:hypothetical protein